VTFVASQQSTPAISHAVVDITPDVSLIKKAGEVNYTIPMAMAELIDNPLDERVPGEKLVVDITVGQRGGAPNIVIRDNAAGMDGTKLRDAMVMARSTKGPEKYGEFGEGLKTSCSFLGETFRIDSTPVGSNNSYSVLYDERSFLAGRKWEISIDEFAKPADVTHGTAINISNLKVNLYAGVKNTLQDSFGRVFRYLLESGELDININDDPVVPIYPETLPEYRTDIEFEVQGKRVWGWASLLRAGSGRGQYGITLIRLNRIVKEFDKLAMRGGTGLANAGLTRVYGEIHLDGFRVVNNKVDFRRDTPEWDEFVTGLNEKLKDLKRESRKMANPGRSITPKAKADVEVFTQKVQDVIRADQLHADLDRHALDTALGDSFGEGKLPFHVTASDSGEGSDEAAVDKTAGDDAETFDRLVGTRRTINERVKRLKTQLRGLRIEHDIRGLGRDSAYKIWTEDGVGARKKLIVTTNIDHPIYSAFPDTDFVLWVRLNIVEAVAEYLSSASGLTDQMLLLKSDILKHIGKMELEMAEETEATAAAK
jgi:hypothetical protein